MKQLVTSVSIVFAGTVVVGFLFLFVLRPDRDKNSQTARPVWADSFSGEIKTDEGFFRVAISESATSRDSEREVRLTSQEDRPDGAPCRLIILGKSPVNGGWTEINLNFQTSKDRFDGGSYIARRKVGETPDVWDWECESSIPTQNKFWSSDSYLGSYNEEIYSAVCALNQAVKECRNDEHVVEVRKWSDHEQKLVTLYRRKTKP